MVLMASMAGVLQRKWSTFQQVVYRRRLCSQKVNIPKALEKDFASIGNVAVNVWLGLKDIFLLIIPFFPSWYVYSWIFIFLLA